MVPCPQFAAKMALGVTIGPLNGYRTNGLTLAKANGSGGDGGQPSAKRMIPSQKFNFKKALKLSHTKTLLQTSRFDVVEMELPSRDGQTHHRAYIRHPGAVVLLPLVDHDTVVMIENERTGVGETLLELPAGTRDPGEPVLTTAGRELVEETGYAAAQLDVVCEFYSAPGLGNELMHLVVAQDLTAGEQQLEATERIKPRLVNRKEIEQLVRSHSIRDSKTLVGLQCFLLDHHLT